MSILEYIILAIGLCFDTLAVSIVSGPFIKKRKLVSFSYFAFMMAIIQAGFILGGVFSGKALVEYLEQIDHWLAFGLLLFIGVRMILQKEDGNNESQSTVNVLKFSYLLLMGIATSIDALFVGFSLGLVISGNDLWILPTIVFIVTASTAIIGLTLGHILGKYTKNFNIIGGSILILIGLRILITSLFN